MNNHLIKEAVAAGLRAVTKDPAALLFIDGELDWTWDQPVIMRLCVYHTNQLICSKWSANINICPFIPIWYNESDWQYLDRRKFAEAYSDAMDSIEKAEAK